MVSSEFLQRRTAQINATNRAAACFLIYELHQYAFSAKGVEALGDGGGVAEEAAAERAREARREGRPPPPRHAPASSVPSSAVGPRGWRLAGEHGALHAVRSARRRRESPLPHRYPSRRGRSPCSHLRFPRPRQRQNRAMRALRSGGLRVWGCRLNWALGSWKPHADRFSAPPSHGPRK